MRNIAIKTVPYDFFQWFYFLLKGSDFAFFCLFEFCASAKFRQTFRF